MRVPRVPAASCGLATHGLRKAYDSRSVRPPTRTTEHEPDSVHGFSRPPTENSLDSPTRVTKLPCFLVEYLLPDNALHGEFLVDAANAPQRRQVPGIGGIHLDGKWRGSTLLVRPCRPSAAASVARHRDPITRRGLFVVKPNTVRTAAKARLVAASQNRNDDPPLNSIREFWAAAVSDNSRTNAAYSVRRSSNFPRLTKCREGIDTVPLSPR